LTSARKEPVDILEAYGSISLKLSGNSSHLVPWHSKLGFTKYPSICTLRSLTPDGGNVAIMNLEIIKVRLFVKL
jgi:breast cancer 2 susceptibility protein